MDRSKSFTVKTREPNTLYVKSLSYRGAVEAHLGIIVSLIVNSYFLPINRNAVNIHKITNSAMYACPQDTLYFSMTAGSLLNLILGTSSSPSSSSWLKIGDHRNRGSQTAFLHSPLSPPLLDNAARGLGLDGDWASWYGSCCVIYDFLQRLSTNFLQETNHFNIMVHGPRNESRWHRQTEDHFSITRSSATA